MADKHDAGYPPLESITRPIVNTAQAAHYILRAAGTLHKWSQAAPEDEVPIRPVRIRGRLGWPVAQIRAVCGVPA